MSKSKTVFRSPAPAWPVGSILLTVTEANPATVIDYGTWELAGSVRLVLIGGASLTVYVWKRTA